MDIVAARWESSKVTTRAAIFFSEMLHTFLTYCCFFSFIVGEDNSELKSCFPLYNFHHKEQNYLFQESLDIILHTLSDTSSL